MVTVVISSKNEKPKQQRNQVQTMCFDYSDITIMYVCIYIHTYINKGRKKNIDAIKGNLTCLLSPEYK
jgi:hypothetical protein